LNGAVAAVSRLDDSEELFAVPDVFEVWAIPATPNFTVEPIDEDRA
jgi:hypothetical protein